MIIVHFGRFFYAKKTARRKALPRLYSLPGELSSAGFTAPSFHLVSPKKEQRDQYYAEEIHKTSEHKITSLERCFTHDQGLLSPFDKSERKLVSIIQLIVRNVK